MFLIIDMDIDMFDLSAQATTDLKRLLAADYMHPHPHAQRHHQQHLRQYHPYDHPSTPQEKDKRETKSRRQCHADAADGGEESLSGCSARSDGCSTSRTAVEAMRRLSLGCSKTT